MRNALAAVLLLMAPGAFAEKLAVLNFSGPDGLVVRTQLSDALCKAHTCVDPKKVSKGSKPDFAKAKKEKVDFLVTGAVKKKGAKRSVELQIHVKAGPPKAKKSFPLNASGELEGKALDNATGWLTKTMGLGEAEAEPEAKKEPEGPPEEKKEPEPEKKEEPEPEKKKVKEPEAPPPPPKEEERKPEEEQPPAPEEGEEKSSNPIFELEAGGDLFSRNFSYNNVSTMNLRSYSASFIFAPELRLEFYPLALATNGFIAGLGIDGSFAYAVGLKSRRSGTEETWSTTLLHYDFDLRFRIKPVSNVDAAVIPFVGYGNRSFSVGLGTMNDTLDGLPGVSYSSVRAGLAGELPFGRFMVFAKFAALIVLSSGQIISSEYFPKGSNFGIEGQVGAGFRIFGPLQVRVAFDFTRYGLGFQSSATDTYQAQGAVDTYIGGNLALRVIF